MLVRSSPSRSVSRGKGGLSLEYNRMPFRLRHYHYDVFDMICRHQGAEAIRASFHSDKKGGVASIAIAFEPTVADIVFTRAGQADTG